MYTDGINEAMNADKNLFSTKRIEATLSGCGNIKPKDITEKMIMAINQFSGNTMQSDDITSLTIRYL